jgi:hypothetical protein
MKHQASKRFREAKKIQEFIRGQRKALNRVARALKPKYFKDIDK